MPDLDNMAKTVRGSWKSAVHAGIQAPEKMGQALAYVLSRCAVKQAGEGSLPLFQEELTALACLPLAEREQAFRNVRFPPSPEGREVAARAARQVGQLICAGKVAATEVSRVLARHFLHCVSQTQFFGRLTEPDLLKIFGSNEAARVHLLGARRELEVYIDGSALAFGESLFLSLQSVEKPDIPKLSTEEHLAQDIDILGMDEFGDEGHER